MLTVSSFTPSNFALAKVLIIEKAINRSEEIRPRNSEELIDLINEKKYSIKDQKTKEREELGNITPIQE